MKKKIYISRLKVLESCTMFLHFHLLSTTWKQERANKFCECDSILCNIGDFVKHSIFVCWWWCCCCLKRKHLTLPRTHESVLVVIANDVLWSKHAQRIEYTNCKDRMQCKHHTHTHTFREMCSVSLQRYRHIWLIIKSFYTQCVHITFVEAFNIQYTFQYIFVDALFVSLPLFCHLVYVILRTLQTRDRRKEREREREIKRRKRSEKDQNRLKEKEIAKMTVRDKERERKKLNLFSM